MWDLPVIEMHHEAHHSLLQLMWDLTVIEMLRGVHRSFLQVMCDLIVIAMRVISVIVEFNNSWKAEAQTTYLTRLI